ncbi:MAG TPA: nucleotide exchange factor GrpE [Thermoplasmata archaeon]|nr:nucleotide exchange factor GrpE [Thermoplasmata archaeon]
MPEDEPPEPEEPASTEAGAPEPAAPAAEDWEKRFTYLYADFENYRRRSEREREPLRRRSQAEVLRGVLPILEASEKAVEAVRSLPPADPVRRGVEMLQKAFARFLTDQGVRTVAEAGEPFRPDEHEAVGEATPPPGVADGTITTVVQQGFAFPGGLLRPAKVVVARRPTPAPVAPEEPLVEHDDAVPSVR